MARHGLKWTLELIDEGVAAYGRLIPQALARAGCIMYQEEFLNPNPPKR